MISKSFLRKKARKIRVNIISSLVPHESHHIGCSLSIVDILTYLYFTKIRLDSQNIYAKNRDIFILSKGHAALALYATLAEKGVINQKLLHTYDTNGTTLPEHTTTTVPGVEFATGSLGHGLSICIGYALSLRCDRSKNAVYTLLSDGEFNEGSTWEAIMFAGFHKLGGITAMVDVNGLQGLGATKDIIDLSPLDRKVRDFHWETARANGHDFSSLETAFKKRQNMKKPFMIFCKTQKGKGVPFFEGKFESHYHSVNQDTKESILKELRSRSR